jgi:hypothetical protein
MAELSRRTFLRRSAAAAAGAAAVAAAGVPQIARAAGDVASGADTGAGDAGADTVVAYVRGGSGEVTLMVGEQEVVARDRDLARRIRRVAR